MRKIINEKKIRDFAKLIKTKLISNSIYLIFSSALHSLIGFIFLIIITRIFNPEQIGIASNLISTLGIIMTFSILGFDESLIKFFPKSKQKKELAGTSFFFSFLASIIISLFLAFILSTLIPLLSDFFKNPFYLLLYVFSGSVWVIFNLIESIFIAVQEAKYVLFKNIVFNVFKIIFPFVLVYLGFFGIFLSWTLPAFISVVFILLITNLKFSLNLKSLSKLIKFSSVNYFSNLLYWLKFFIIPLIITVELGPDFTAFYIIPFNFLNIFYIVPKSLGKSLFSDVTNDDSNSASKTGKVLFLSLFSSLFFFAFVFFLGKFILSFFGSSYAVEGYRLLCILGLAGFFIAFNEIYLTIAKHKSDLFSIFLIKGVSSILTVFFVLLLITKGLDGIGYSFLFGEMIISLIFIFKFSKVNKKGIK